METRRIVLAMALVGLGGCSDLAVYQGADGVLEAARDAAHVDATDATDALPSPPDVVNAPDTAAPDTADAADAADAAIVADVTLVVDTGTDVPPAGDSGFCGTTRACGPGSTCSMTTHGPACCAGDYLTACNAVNCPATGGPYPYFCAPEVSPTACCWTL